MSRTKAEIPTNEEEALRFIALNLSLSRFLILKATAEDEEGMTLGQLGRIGGISGAAMTGTRDVFNEYNLTTEHSGGDRRLRWLKITERGRKVLATFQTLAHT